MSHHTENKPSKGVLVDLTKCIGCGSCTVACKMYNGNKWIETKAPTDGEKAKLADENWTVVRKCNVKNADGKAAWRFVKQQCLHCKDPACVTACLSRAFQKTADGPVVYYPNNCIGCRYCMIGCPFDVPKFEWNKTFPVMTKCMMCSGRVGKGEADSKYQKHIYGEEEAGGTCWIYISDRPFAELGFKDVPKKTIAKVTEPFMHFSLPLGLLWGCMLAGLYFITGRRNKIAKKAEDKSEPKGKSEPEA